jgi:hypothetical protein
MTIKNKFLSFKKFVKNKLRNIKNNHKKFKKIFEEAKNRLISKKIFIFKFDGYYGYF